MAQMERARRSSETPNTPVSHQTSPTFNKLLRVEETRWSPRNASPTYGMPQTASPTYGMQRTASPTYGMQQTTSPTYGMNNIQQEYPTSPNSNKKSVLAKVKERAKKLKHSLSGRRKLENEMNNGPGMHPWPTLTFDSHDMDDDDDDDDELERDPEYLGAPMYESEAAPESLKETARQHPRAVPVISEHRRTPTSMKCKVAQNNQKQAPASNAINRTASKSTCGGKNSVNLDQREVCSTQTWDKGVSVKEYFMSKLKPGDNEKALSEAISEAISPRSSARDPGVVQKVKGAVTSFLWHQEPLNTSTEIAASSSLATSNVRTRSLQKSASARSSRSDHSSLQIPVSDNACKGTEEENHGRILQAN